MIVVTVHNSTEIRHTPFSNHMLKGKYNFVKSFIIWDKTQKPNSVLNMY
jgi:hypothetical protein